MKNSKIVAATLVCGMLIFSQPTLAGSKQKPPVAEAQVEVTWFQSFINFFSF